jgi:hypothetical protein
MLDGLLSKIPLQNLPVNEQQVEVFVTNLTEASESNNIKN